MIAPPAMNIYSAQTLMVSDFIREHQIKELKSAIPDASEDFQKGYELGLAVARVVLAGSAELMLKGVDPKEIL